MIWLGLRSSFFVRWVANSRPRLQRWVRLGLTVAISNNNSLLSISRLWELSCVNHGFEFEVESESVFAFLDLVSMPCIGQDCDYAYALDHFSSPCSICTAPHRTASSTEQPCQRRT